MAALIGNPLVVGIDLGGTKILAGVVDSRARILSRAKVPTPAHEGAGPILAALVQGVNEALALAGVSADQVAGIGVGSPGPLDSARGVILFSANLNVRDFALGPDLGQAVGLPVLVENDVRVGGYGEFRLGAGRGYRDVLTTFVGTGIGGCLIWGGEVVTGATGNAGELGHMIVKAGGPRCGCGALGCLEALASRTAIARRILKAARKGTPTVLRSQVSAKGGRLKSKDLAAAVSANDPVTVKEVRRAAHFLGLGLGGLINVLGPEIVLVGGGVTEALGAPWVDLVRASARQQAMTDRAGRIPIEPAALGDDAGLLGAALLARERFAPESLPTVPPAQGLRTGDSA